MKNYVENDYKICSMVELDTKYFPSFVEVKKFF